MARHEDSLFVRAAAVIEKAREARTETQRVLDTARLQRLKRELFMKMAQIEQLKSHARRPKQKSGREH
jgi:hypothetical protein